MLPTDVTGESERTFRISILDGEFHRRRIKTEEKAKVGAAAWGGRIDFIPCRASYFAPGRFEE